ncbi:Enoyl-CoA hydratase/carnithine racemase [Shimia gijangensis]|uniref:Enoyl-CoA hydratase/carnithine racemase n=1 Tax=Shimia gijangensis TaxID=1470563 RepID=A0A1M6THI8_9RHOB|nr:enoyl-CoA hydratase/isomerase family protein [Shimia gijangensis]SHK56359.1 Enoyl-CoA hydratase/carnithine racemase [Shimia gijangensis]
MTDFQYNTVISRLEDNGIRVVSLNRPDRLNAMNRALVTDVAKAFDDANACKKTRVIIFTGEGRAFCAGDDRKDHNHPESEQEARDITVEIQDATRSIVFGDKPVVGALRGWAVGGGFEWAINCDFPIWAESGKAFFPEMSLGIFVTGAVTALLPALAGLQKAREMLYLGQTYSAQDLHDAGVAWRVVPDDGLMKEAYKVATTLADLPYEAVISMKRALNVSGQAAIKAALDMETEATVAGFLNAETTKRMLDFG